MAEVGVNATNTTHSEDVEHEEGVRFRMLKKAKSFRNDIKDRISGHIKRSHSNATEVPTSPTKTAKGAKTKSVARTGSFSEGTKTDKQWKQSNVEKLKQESKKVFQYLGYLEKAVVKGVMIQQIPEAVTVVLEAVMDLSSLLGTYFINQDSSVLLSSQNKVYQKLAQLVKWADTFILNEEQPLNKDGAAEIIKAVSDALKEWVQISSDKLQNKSYLSLPKSAGSRGSSTSNPESPGRTSLPDIPLTPREREILEQTNMGDYDNNFGFKDSDIYGNNNTLLPGAPPPKPPLPENRVSPLMNRSSAHSMDSPETEGETPPPLPRKKRSNSNVMEYNPSQGGSSSTPISHRSPQSSIFGGTTSTTTLDSLNLSPPFLSPLSTSPASSVGSGLNQSREDLLDSSKSEENLMEGFTQAHFIHHTASWSSSTSTTSGGGGIDDINELTKKIQSLTTGIEQPPPLPEKRNNASATRTRYPSDYDNVDPGTVLVPVVTSTVTTVSSATGVAQMKTSQSTASYTSFQQKAMYSKSAQFTTSQGSFSSTETSSIGTLSSTESSQSLQKPPPLPPKKRHVEAYMQMFGNYSHPTSHHDFTRHSVHSENYYQSQWYQHQMELFHPRSHTMSLISDLTRPESDLFSIGSGASVDDLLSLHVPALPPKLRTLVRKRQKSGRNNTTFTTDSGTSDTSSFMDSVSTTGSFDDTTSLGTESLRSDSLRSDSLRSDSIRSDSLGPPSTVVESEPAKFLLPPKTKEPESSTPEKDTDSDFAELNPLDDVDVSDQLVRKKKGESGPEIRGGSVDALVVHATAAGKHDFMYQEAFLTTYRTFISPDDLINKLLYRYQKFANMSDTGKKRLSRNAFSLLVRVVDELCGSELNEQCIQTLLDQVCQLLCDGELMLARILRKKALEKVETRKLHQITHHMSSLTSHSLTSRPMHLTLFKSQDIAEQMTLMDAELFQRIEIPEMLRWSREQSEESCPNLTEFTEHFNKMSYWCRSLILKQEDPRERERYFIKFIKIMKYLRKYNNFNSYLALLSAVDSAPIRRLEWQRQNMDALKEFCELIDSSSSFKAYRQALAETEPPCIPYIGLILQDLTFVHIGNPNNLPEGSINFAKRWQQFNILDNMKRFKKCNYGFKKNPKIIGFFNNFDDYLSEEAQWQLSESIKPRGTRKKPDT
ncbi:rap guanine nucleotide exchange factor 1 isoform X3 [Lingula anatina]|uniref:CRK SH3-binding GNRP n=1 Tax=Lingula anatina TaxID=7574 RepID=A0A1S3KDD1_LINAN|nr:rap guanine nucleotide exchange factor 1 isoform X3 [Lingula anatina]|eukprot:XP_013420266.1 rap guanine nucleotide exchange factor 1 isoform X3 [Lingula anatina]